MIIWQMFYGNDQFWIVFLVRCVTVMMETGDPNILIGYFFSVTLNYLIIAVAIYYTPKEKVTQEKKTE